MEDDGQNVDNEIAAEEIEKLSKDEEEAEMVVQCEPIRSLVVCVQRAHRSSKNPTNRHHLHVNFNYKFFILYNK